jgi:20S proteasome subunit alpha 7
LIEWQCSVGVALRVKDGIIFGVEKLTIAKMMIPSSNKRIFNIDTHVGMAVAGFVPDARQLVNRARYV